MLIFLITFPLQMLFAWLIQHALGVVLPAFGYPSPAYWVVFWSWFLFFSVASALRARAE